MLNSQPVHGAHEEYGSGAALAYHISEGAVKSDIGLSSNAQTEVATDHDCLCYGFGSILVHIHSTLMEYLGDIGTLGG